MLCSFVVEYLGKDMKLEIIFRANQAMYPHESARNDLKTKEEQKEFTKPPSTH